MLSRISQLFSPLSLRLRALKRSKRFVPGSVRIGGIRFFYPDPVSFAWQYHEVFLRRLYQFDDPSARYIIDGGANVGLSVIFFRSIAPEARIIAFEPDDKIFAYLRRNIASAGISGIELVNKGLLDREGMMQFNSEGADGGKLRQDGDVSDKGTMVSVTSLRPYLDRKVDFLKLDIEGSEAAVLSNCADLLPNVQKLFVEYHSSVGQAQQLADMLAVISGAGFRYFIESATIRNDRPFVNRVDLNGYDNLLNIYAWRD